MRIRQRMCIRHGTLIGVFLVLLCIPPADPQGSAMAGPAVCGSGPNWVLRSTFPDKGMISVRSVAWSPDGLSLASGSSDNKVRIWDPATLAVRFTMAHDAMVNSVSWSPDGLYLASGSNDRTIKIWDATKGTLIRTLNDQDSYAVNAVAWSPDGTLLIHAQASRDSVRSLVHIWNTSTWEAITTDFFSSPSNQIYALDWSPIAPNGTMQFATAAWCSDCTVQIWSATGQLVRTLDAASASRFSIAWSPSNLRIASGNGSTITGCSNCLYLYHRDTLTSPWVVDPQITAHSGRVYGLAWCPNSGQSLLASGGGAGDGKIKIWDVSTRIQIQEWLAHDPSGPGPDNAGTKTVAWSPDGGSIASGGGSDGLIKIWTYSQ